MASLPTALSFCYAAATSRQYDHSSAVVQPDLRPTCDAVGARLDCAVTVADARDVSHRMQLDSAFHYNLTLAGQDHAVNAARAELLTHCPLIVELRLPIPASEMPTKDECDTIATDTHTKITLNDADLIIAGTPDQVVQARIKVLLLLDHKASLRTESHAIPLKLHYLICGRRRANLQPIIEETATNIYFPSPFCSDSETEQVVYISGQANAATRAKEMLKRLADQKARSMYHKKANFHAKKLDWMWFHCQDDLRKMMHDNGSFIQLPPLGSGQSEVLVYAESRVNAERTLRMLNALSCTIYEGFFYFKHNAITMQNPTGVNTWVSVGDTWQTEIADLSRISGAEVVYSPQEDCIQVLGSERAIRNAYQHLQSIPHLVANHARTTFKVESARDHRDFISGKKDGKISKIVSKTGADITYKDFTDDNFVIEITNTNFGRALDGLSGLQEELPAEISFVVPETYHKRIIGVRGSTIQTIMKRYGVYVKFANTEEFAALGGYIENEDNVVARTPMKNQIQLENLRHAVQELVSVRDRNYVRRPLRIPFRMHRTIVSEHADTLAQEFKAHHARLWWPEQELASDIVILFCPEAEVDAMLDVMKTLVPIPITAASPTTESVSHRMQFNSTSVPRATEPMAAMPSGKSGMTPSPTFPEQLGTIAPPSTSSSPSSYPPSLSNQPFPRFMFDGNTPASLNHPRSATAAAPHHDPPTNHIISHNPIMNPHAMPTLHNPDLFSGASTADTFTMSSGGATAMPAAAAAAASASAATPASIGSDPFSLGHTQSQMGSQHDLFAPSMDNLRAIFDQSMDDASRSGGNYRNQQQRASLPSLALPQRTPTRDIWANPPGQSGPGGGAFRGLYSTTQNNPQRSSQGFYAADWSFGGGGQQQQQQQQQQQHQQQQQQQSPQSHQPHHQPHPRPPPPS